MRDRQAVWNRTNQLWLDNSGNESDDQGEQLDEVKDAELKTSRVWAIREPFHWFWHYECARPRRSSPVAGPRGVVCSQ